MEDPKNILNQKFYTRKIEANVKIKKMLYGN